MSPALLPPLLVTFEKFERVPALRGHQMLRWHAMRPVLSMQSGLRDAFPGDHLPRPPAVIARLDPAIHEAAQQCWRYGFACGICGKASVITRIFCGAGYAVLPLSCPSKYEGDGAPSGATIVLSCRVPSRERGRLSARHRGVLLPAAGPRFAGVVRRVDGRRQPAPGGQPVVAAGRSPGAARVRALRGTPAGAASCSTIKTPLDDAPR